MGGEIADRDQHDLGVVVELDDRLPPAGKRWIERARHLSWAISSRVELPIDQMPDRPWRDHHAPAVDPTDAEWAAALGDIPRTHRLAPAQLRQVERAHAASGGDLDRAVRRLASGQIDKLARRIRPTRTWADIIVAPDRIQLLRELVARYRHADEVYDGWGFSASPSRGQVALFSGPSGTGKTLAAEIIAGELGLDLFKLDLSAVVSKYIGETEKNLDQIFDAARAGNVVLFFDEADSLFGKRSEVKDARDRYANIEVSYLLQRLEAYDGLVTLATNFERNIDEAFLRRIHVRVEFSSPDEAERKAIWEHNLPARAPIGSDVDLAFIARQFELTGGSIRNATLQAAFIAAAGSGVIDMDCLVLGVAREYQKLGRLLKVEDFAPYAHVIAH
ncbi:MAG: ATP-binding protein [Ilumatobacteraceae bacterium]